MSGQVKVFCQLGFCYSFIVLLPPTIYTGSHDMGKPVIAIEVDSVQDLFQRLLRVLAATYSSRRRMAQTAPASRRGLLDGRLVGSPHESKEVTILKMRHRTVWVQFQRALNILSPLPPSSNRTINAGSESAVPFRQFVVEFHCFLRG